MTPEITVIAPLLNEEGNVYELYERLRSACNQTGVSCELLLVDDGSTDSTLQVIEKISRSDSNVKYLSFTRNFGHQNALFAGIENSRGRHIVLIDGDLQDPPELIPQLWNRLQEGFDVVYAKRSARQGESFLKKLTAAAFYRLLNKMTAIRIPADTGDFRIMKREVAEELMKMRDNPRFLRGQIAWMGFCESHVMYERKTRTKGRSGFGYASMLRLAWDGITGFSDLPLRFASISGIIVSMVSFIMIGYVLMAKYLWHQTITGWTSIMVAILFLGGIQLLSIGIIGEYLSRINQHVRQRQSYIIRKTNIS